MAHNISNAGWASIQARQAAYCRVSAEHEEQETSLEMQEAHFRAIMQKAGWRDSPKIHQPIYP